MKKMTKHEEEIFQDIVRVLQKITQIEEEDNIELVSEHFLQCISAALEDLTGLKGMTEQIFVREEEETEGEPKLD